MATTERSGAASSLDSPWVVDLGKLRGGDLPRAGGKAQEAAHRIKESLKNLLLPQKRMQKKQQMNTD